MFSSPDFQESVGHLCVFVVEPPGHPEIDFFERGLPLSYICGRPREVVDVYCVGPGQAALEDGKEVFQGLSFFASVPAVDHNPGVKGSILLEEVLEPRPLLGSLLDGVLVVQAHLANSLATGVAD